MFLISHSNVNDQIPLTGYDVNVLYLRHRFEIGQSLVNRGPLLSLESNDDLHTKSECHGVHVCVISLDNVFAFKRATCSEMAPGDIPHFSSQMSHRKGVAVLVARS